MSVSSLEVVEIYAANYNRLVKYVNTEYANSTQTSDTENRQQILYFKNFYYKNYNFILQVFHALYIGLWAVTIEREPPSLHVVQLSNESPSFCC